MRRSRSCWRRIEKVGRLEVGKSGSGHGIEIDLTTGAVVPSGGEGEPAQFTMKKIIHWTIMLTLCGACAPRAIVHLESAGAQDGQLLTVVADPEFKINARLPPALDLADSTVLRFHSDSITPDSAYFTAPPTAFLPGAVPPHGRLHVGICRKTQSVCNVVTLRI